MFDRQSARVRTQFVSQTSTMSEIIFEVREAEEGGFWARALS